MGTRPPFPRTAYAPAVAFPAPDKAGQRRRAGGRKEEREREREEAKDGDGKDEKRPCRTPRGDVAKREGRRQAGSRGAACSAERSAPALVLLLSAADSVLASPWVPCFLSPPRPSRPPAGRALIAAHLFFGQAWGAATGAARGAAGLRTGKKGINISWPRPGGGIECAPGSSIRGGGGGTNLPIGIAML